MFNKSAIDIYCELPLFAKIILLPITVPVVVVIGAIAGMFAGIWTLAIEAYIRKYGK